MDPNRIQAAYFYEPEQVPGLADFSSRPPFNFRLISQPTSSENTTSHFPINSKLGWLLALLPTDSLNCCTSQAVDLSNQVMSLSFSSSPFVGRSSLDMHGYCHKTKAFLPDRADKMEIHNKIRRLRSPDGAFLKQQLRRLFHPTISSIFLMEYRRRTENDNIKNNTTSAKAA